MLTVVAEDGTQRGDISLLDDVAREGARRMPAAALEAEVDAYLSELAGERDERGRRLVVRNGYAQPLREVFPDKVANILNALPKSAHPGAKTALAEVYNAEDERHAHAAAKAFASPPSPPCATAPGSPRGPGSRAAGPAMAFKLIESAQQRWRAVNAPHLVALVRAGATFSEGQLVERPTDQVAA